MKKASEIFERVDYEELLADMETDKEQSAIIEELKAENAELKESLAIEKEVSEGAIFANNQNFNLGEGANEIMSNIINALSAENAKLREVRDEHIAKVISLLDENADLRKGLIEVAQESVQRSNEMAKLEAEVLALKAIFEKHGITEANNAPS